MNAVCRFKDESRDLLEPIEEVEISSGASHQAGYKCVPGERGNKRQYHFQAERS